MTQPNTPLSSADRLIDSIKKNEQNIDISIQDTQGLAEGYLGTDDAQKNIEEEAQKLSTSEELRRLKNEIAEERTEFVNSREAQTDFSTEETLKTIEENINEMADVKEAAEKAATPDYSDQPVADLAVEKPAAERSKFENIMNTITESGIFGSLIKGWISIQKTWMSFFPPKNEAEAERQLAGIEQLYGRFFGGTELRDSATAVIAKMNESGKTVPLDVKKGLGDSVAYAQVKIEYSTFLEDQLKASGITDMNAITSANPFDAFFAGKVEKYVTGKGLDNPDPTKRYQTTLMGIVQNRNPLDITA